MGYVVIFTLKQVGISSLLKALDDKKIIILWEVGCFGVQVIR